jgi:hypothetical protein
MFRAWFRTVANRGTGEILSASPLAVDKKERTTLAGVMSGEA